MLLLPYFWCFILLVHYYCACTFYKLCYKLLNQMSFFFIVARSAPATAFFPSLLILLNTTGSIWVILQNDSQIIHTKSLWRLSLVMNFLCFFGDEIGGLRSCENIKIGVLFLLVFIELLFWGLVLSLLLIGLGLAWFFTFLIADCTHAGIRRTTYASVGSRSGNNISLRSIGRSIEN